MSDNDNARAMANLAQRIDTALNIPFGRVITFIAARPGEGTSTVARDYAHALADFVDHDVLLIDAGKIDHDFFLSHSADPAVTMADTLAAGKPLKDGLFTLAGHTFLGRWAGNSRNRSHAAKLLNDDAFWEKLRKDFGTIVIDTPSLKESADGINLAARSDATIMVVEAETTRQPVVEHLRDSLTQAGAKILGMVMNKRRLYIPEKVYQKI